MDPLSLSDPFEDSFLLSSVLRFFDVSEICWNPPFLWFPSRISRYVRCRLVDAIKCQNPDFRTPVWLDRQRSSSVSALLRRRSSGSSASGNSSVGSFGIWNVSTGAAFSVLALGLLSQLTGAGNTSLRNVYGMSPQRSPSVLCLSTRSKLGTGLGCLLCCFLDRGRSQAQGISLFGRSAGLRMCEGRSVERDN